MKVLIDDKDFAKHAGILAHAIAEPRGTKLPVIEVSAASVEEADAFINVLNSTLGNQITSQQF